MPRYSEEQIREYAHKLWEREGRPEGKADDFWHQAKSELESDAPGDERPETGARVGKSAAQAPLRHWAGDVVTGGTLHPIKRFRLALI
ncbi:DUF2934 domain-containing protein [Tardiphaga sp. P5_C10]